jgi:carboxymethylenebutenolidase
LQLRNSAAITWARAQPEVAIERNARAAPGIRRGHGHGRTRPGSITSRDRQAAMTAPEIRTSHVTIPVADGTAMGGYLAAPAAPGPHPAIFVIQEIFGVNEHIRDVTERFARAGYLALAPEIFHRFAPGYQGSYDDIPASVALTSKLTPEAVTADLAATHAWLAARDDVRRGAIAAIGYCMGGRLAFVANAMLPLGAAVSYYGGGIATNHLALAGALRGPQLLVWAGNDPYIPPADRDRVHAAVRDAGKRYVNVEFSGVNHGFFCDARSDYDAGASRQAWALTMAFLDDALRAA